ncbi:FtsW/RodA/SpoVE family cell cycle protein [Flaviflexus massiliensis]|uniref:FtsW/RodA/SpoVE family cell cycle protein n=1 Tax=Flaviflexus massiliensis TaxID=1522309 RepID=UPI0006D57139|nr:FtsW/RodA/SpoVE family cell cycle protein [Flaviflexus massiliensis]
MATITHLAANPGRLPEFFLTLISAIIGVGGYALVHLGSEGELPGNIVTFAAVFGAMALVAHLLIRWAAPYADPVIFPTALALNGIGIAMIERIDLYTGSSESGSQTIFMLLGVVLAVLTLITIRDHRMLRRFTYTSLIIGAILLLLPLIPGLGREIYGARIWINMAGFSFQPAELAKIFFAIFFAGYLVVNRDNLALAGPKFLGLQLPQLRHFAPIMLAWAVCLAVLVFQKDLGTSILFFGLFVSMLYVATDRLSWIIIGGILALGGGFVVLQFFPHVAARFNVWLNAMDPEVYNAAFGSYQVVQGNFGMASGGLFGSGLGQGYPGIVPQANSDFIIASLGEELGMAGVFAILALYLVIVVRGLRSAAYVRDGFGKLLASGLSFVIALQVFVVVGGVTRLIPLTGLTLPLVALGGSSLLCNWIVIGLLLRISNGARSPMRGTGEPLPPAWEESEIEYEDDAEIEADNDDSEDRQETDADRAETEAMRLP